MERRDGWEHYLDEFIFKRKRSSFRYGKNDCCLFVADAIERMTGVDPAEKFRGQYKTKSEAYDLLKRFSNGEIEETVNKLAINYGMKRIDSNFAGRGDVVLVSSPMGNTLGVVVLTGEQVAIPARKGLMFYPTISILKAWRVG